SILRSNDFTALYDKGYHTGSELKTAQDLGIETIVAIPGVPSTSQSPDHDYNYEHFKYDPLSDTYTCPEGEVLKTNGKWYTTHGRRDILISFKQYKTRACKTCPARLKCTRSKTGRLIERSIYAENYERNRKNKEEKEQLYKRRQAIAEHPFGTIKRQWGFSYILTKRGINHASSDVGFMFIAYNFRRIISILGKDPLIKYLRILASFFLTVSAFFQRRISRLEASVFLKIVSHWQIQPSPKSL
ncbi:MAG: transposase, partial [Flavisolibacter sp.]